MAGGEAWGRRRLAWVGEGGCLPGLAEGAKDWGGGGENPGAGGPQILDLAPVEKP